MAKMTSNEARRQDTREKIALGGLIIKAGLRHERPAVLLGALIELQSRLKTDGAERDRLRKIGAEAFGHDGG